MDQLKFGDILRSTRERKGLDFAQTAQRLRIRPDILRAIEESNISAMPARGYARNMVTGYARYLGLDPNEMARLYVEELQVYEDRRARVRARMNGEDQDASESFREDRSARVSSRAVPRGDGSLQRSGSQQRVRRAPSGSGRQVSDAARTVRMSRLGDEDDAPRRGAGRDAQDTQRSHPLQAAAGSLFNAASNVADSQRRPSFNAAGRGRQSRDPLLKANDYVSFYQERGAGVESKLPFIIAAAVVLLSLIIILSLAMGHGGSKKAEDVTTLPVTAIEESVQQQDVETAPTKFTFAYKIDEGTEAWTEVYVDGEAQLAEVVTGPSEGSYDITGTVQFRCVTAEGVHVTIDGEEKELEYDDTGMVNMTFDFASYLSDWQEAHGQSTSSGSAADASAGQQDAGSASEADDAAATAEAAADAAYADPTTYSDSGAGYTEETVY
jgi:cytoskeleton protein RodZ